jgi:hypothetical protein
MTEDMKPCPLQSLKFPSNFELIVSSPRVSLFKAQSPRTHIGSTIHALNLEHNSNDQGRYLGAQHFHNKSLILPAGRKPEVLHIVVTPPDRNLKVARTGYKD